VREAFAPLYASILRTGIVLLAALLLSLLASLVLARRMVRPINALREGAAGIAAGKLDQRIEVRTGDELEALAEQFNDMTAKLGESYAGLERKVEERTHELAIANSTSRFPRQHEPRDPHADERDHRHGASGAEDRADAAQRDYLRKIQGSSDHLLGIINDILDFSKIEAGKLAVEHVDFELAKLLDDVAILVGEKTDAKGLALEFDIADDVPASLVGDALRLRQILVNYANNAVKFTEQGEVQLIARVRERASTTCCSISPCATPESGWPRSRSHGCSRASTRPTPRPRANSAAPDSAWRFPSSWPSSWVEKSAWKASPARAAPSGSPRAWA